MTKFLNDAGWLVMILVGIVCLGVAGFSKQSDVRSALVAGGTTLIGAGVSGYKSTHSASPKEGA